MNETDFYLIIRECESIIRRVRKDSPVEAGKSYVDKILYCLTSKIYMEGVREDVCVIEELSGADASILDFGTGIGNLAALLCTSGNKVEAIDTILDKSIKGQSAIDSNRDRNEILGKVWAELEKYFENLKFRLYNGKIIPFDNNKFDIVFAYAVLEHIPGEELDAILHEIYRVIKLGGFLYVSRLPKKWSAAENLARVLNIPGHEILIDEKQLLDRLKSHGFEILESSKHDMVPGYPPVVWNPAFPFWAVVDRLLTKTPLTIFAHHLRIIAKKSAK